jgi:hypothetical protein
MYLSSLINISISPELDMATARCRAVQDEKLRYLENGQAGGW